MLNAPQQYRLLAKFQELFDGKIYKHRISTQGDTVALELYEDLFVRATSRSTSSKFVTRVNAGTRVVNPKNKNYGMAVRRGDGTLGELMHGALAVPEVGFAIRRGPTVFTEIGAEVKILAKAMRKQIGRVCTDLNDQVDAFNKYSGARPPIAIALVGINHSKAFCSYEGANRQTIADGTRQPNGLAYASPASEAASVKVDLLAKAAPSYFGFLLLEFSATNMPPYPFTWLNANKTTSDYNAFLTRLAIEYEAKF